MLDEKMNNLPMADAEPKGFDREKIMKIIFSRNLVGLANNTKWNELITAVRSHGEWRPSYRTKSVTGYISGWDIEWFYHLPFPFLSVEWFDISLESPPGVNTEWVLNLVEKIGFEFEVNNSVLRIWGYGPKSYEQFN
jgi:hypothetical protein